MSSEFGSKHCSDCNDGLQWWLMQMVKRAHTTVIGGQSPHMRPIGFVGVCAKCQEGYCKKHAPEGLCPKCGSKLEE